MNHHQLTRRPKIRLPRRFAIGPSVTLAVGAALAAAPTIPAATFVPPNLNPGALQQQTLKHKPAPAPASQPAGPVLSSQTPSTQPTIAKGGPAFTLSRIAFSHSKFLKPAQLQALAQPYLHHPIHLGDLQKLVGQVNALYLKEGYLTARAILPPQKITGGLVRIELVEGKLGEVTLKGNSATWPNYVLSRLPLKPGQVVNDRDLAQSLNFFNRTNSVQLKAALQPGKTFGLTNILLYAQEPRRLTLDLDVDNYGNPATGRLEGSEYLNVYSPLKLDDRINLYSVQSQGGIDNSLSYSIPITTFGTRIGASYEFSNIHIVNGAYSGIDVRGRSWQADGSLTQPLLATQHWYMQAGFDYSYNSSHTLVGGLDLGPTNVSRESLGLTMQGNFSRGALSLIQTISYSRGADPLDNVQHPFIYNGNFYGFFDFTPQVYASLLSGWQYTPTNGVSPVELFQMGGPYSVRGFSTDGITGDSGFFSQLELHYRATSFADAYVFYDGGVLFSQYPTEQHEQAMGLGARWTFLKNHITANTWIGFPFNRVLPDQQPYIIGAKLVFHLP